MVLLVYKSFRGFLEMVFGHKTGGFENSFKHVLEAFYQIN